MMALYMVHALFTTERLYFIYCLFSCIRFVVFIYRLVNKVDHINAN